MCESAINKCIVSSEEAITYVAGAESVATADLGSCSVHVVRSEGVLETVVLTSSGHAMRLPADLSSLFA